MGNHVPEQPPCKEKPQDGASEEIGLCGYLSMLNKGDGRGYYISALWRVLRNCHLKLAAMTQQAVPKHFPAYSPP